MATSIYLAKLIGPVFAAVGLGMLVNSGTYHVMGNEFLQSYAMIYLSGLLALPVGLAILLAHNVWTRDWRVIITIVGCLATIGGVLRLVVPQFVAAVGTTVFAHSGVITGAAILVLALGGFLSFKAYSQ